MTERAQQLHATTDAQISELMSLISTLDDAALRLPCPGREKLGDGTIAASARRTADSYQRIGAFVQTSGRMSGTHQPDQHRAHRIPRLLRALGHGPADHAEHGPANTTARAPPTTSILALSLTSSRHRPTPWAGSLS
jgi:hypothetical protein